MYASVSSAHVADKKIVAIQYLRGIAALMVTIHHARDRLPGFLAALPNPVGEAGVDLFFVISGFIMVMITSSPDVRPGAFMWRRVIRIVPMYWLYTTALALIIAIAPGALRLPLTLEHYLYSILFIPHLDPNGRSIEPLLQPGWTLNFEMFFYCLFALSLFVDMSRRPLVLIGALVGLVVWGQVFPPESPPVEAYTSPLLLEFAAGVLLGYLYRSGRFSLASPIIGWTLIASGAVIALYAATFILPRPFTDFTTSPLRVATYGLTSVLVTAGALVLEAGRKRGSRHSSGWKFLGLLGDASYALYLTHLFAIVLVRLVWLHLGFATEGVPSALIFVFIATLVSVALALLSYFLLERPLHRGVQDATRLRSSG